MVFINMIACTMMLLGDAGSISGNISLEQQKVLSLLEAKGLTEGGPCLKCCNEMRVWVDPESFELDGKIYRRVLKKGGKRVYKSSDDEMVFFLRSKVGQLDELVKDELWGYVAATLNVGASIDTLSAGIQIRNDENLVIIESLGSASVIVNGIDICVRRHPRSHEPEKLASLAKAILEAGLKKAEEEE